MAAKRVTYARSRITAATPRIFPLACILTASRVARGVGWREHLADIATLPQGSKLRISPGHHPTLSAASRAVISWPCFRDQAAQASKRGRTPITILQTAITPNCCAVHSIGGLTINVSTETETAADAAISMFARHLACQALRPDPTWRTPQGNIVMVCPAQRRGDAAYSTCMLCHKRGGRRVIVTFISHGATRKSRPTANATLRSAMHKPTKDCPAWINAPDDATEQLFRECDRQIAWNQNGDEAEPLPIGGRHHPESASPTAIERSFFCALLLRMRRNSNTAGDLSRCN